MEPDCSTAIRDRSRHRWHLLSLCTLSPIAARCDEKGSADRCLRNRREWNLVAGNERRLQFLGDLRARGPTLSAMSVQAPAIFAAPLKLLSVPAAGGFVARPAEVSILGSAGSVRPNEVRLALGSQHRELGVADVHGADRFGACKETGTRRWKGSRDPATARSGNASRSGLRGRWVERG